MRENAQFADSADPRALIADDKTVNDQAPYLMELVTPFKAAVPRSAKIAIKIEGRIVFIDPAEVISAEAQGNYVLLVQTARSHLLRGSIADVAEKLLPYGFIRIHRSVLLNASWVTEIQPHSTGEYLVRTRSGKEYTASRTYKKNLRALAQIWIGGETLFAG
jgi:two-component system LytT family response regulator